MKKEIHYVSADEAVKVIKSGDHVHLSSVASAPQILINAMCRRGDRRTQGRESPSSPHRGAGSVY